MTVLIAGSGIAGLTLGLTLEQLGIPFRIHEAVARIQPLGVGVNLQPHAVRELMDLGLAADLEAEGLRTRQYGFYTRTGLPIWVEPRGLDAGYAWPQYSIHRGRLQMLLLRRLVDRCGEDVLITGSRASGHACDDTGVTLQLATRAGPATDRGTLLIAADGIHSAIRRQLYPQEGPPVWKGAILWRGTTRAPPFLGGAAMALAGHDSQRFVAYPISAPDPQTGRCLINWIAEKRTDPALGFRREDWNRPADPADFAPDFADWRFDWLDIPAVIAAADAIYEYPMVDRDPVDRWTDGRTLLIGDAAHPTYPVGSTGASQAIVDARLLGACLARHGVHPAALAAFERDLLPRMNAMILANRGSGPDAVMQMVEDRCGGRFARIEDVIDPAVLAEHAARYKRLAGFAVEDINRRPPIIGPRRPAQ